MKFNSLPEYLLFLYQLDTILPLSNYRLRLVISTINIPTRFLEQNFNMILKNSLPKSNYTVKNSWEFQKITNTIPDCHVMISLDLVAMFPNIPLELVKKSCFK